MSYNSLLTPSLSLKKRKHSMTMQSHSRTNSVINAPRSSLPNIFHIQNIDYNEQLEKQNKNINDLLQHKRQSSVTAAPQNDIGHMSNQFTMRKAYPPASLKPTMKRHGSIINPNSVVNQIIKNEEQAELENSLIARSIQVGKNDSKTMKQIQSLRGLLKKEIDKTSFKDNIESKFII